MDPVTLTAAVASLTFTCAKVIKCFNAIKSTYQTAPVTIITMLAECATVSASLNQIQNLAHSNPIALSSRMAPTGSLTKNFDDALTGCMLTLSVIEDELEGMVEGDQGVGTVGFKAKAKFLWNETAMATLLQQLRGQQTAIGLLVAVLQTESIAEVKEMVQKNTDTLQTMLQRALTLRGSQPTRPGKSGASTRPASIFSFGMSSTVAGPSPDLNSQLHQSSAYQRARAVEMEDLWKRNHELLQEKYTLIEKIEQLEEEEKKTIERVNGLLRDLDRCCNRLKLSESDLIVTEKELDELERLYTALKADKAKDISTLESSAQAAINEVYSENARKCQEMILGIEKQLQEYDKYTRSAIGQAENYSSALLRKIIKETKASDDKNAEVEPVKVEEWVGLGVNDLPRVGQRVIHAEFAGQDPNQTHYVEFAGQGSRRPRQQSPQQVFSTFGKPPAIKSKFGLGLRSKGKSDYRGAVNGQIDPRAVDGQIGQRAVNGQIDPRAVNGQIDPRAIFGQIGPRAVDGQIHHRT